MRRKVRAGISAAIAARPAASPERTEPEAKGERRRRSVWAFRCASTGIEHRGAIAHRSGQHEFGRKSEQEVAEIREIEGRDFPGALREIVASLTSLFHGAPDAEARVAALVETLSKEISVKRSERNYILDVEVRAGSPEKAERLARGLADAGATLH